MATFKDYADGSCNVRIRLKSVYDSKTFKTRKEAEVFASKREAEILLSASNAKTLNAEILTFEQVCNAYFDSPQFSAKADSTKKAERVKYKAVNLHFGNQLITHIDFTAIQAYLHKRSQQSSYSNERVRNNKISSDTIRLEKAFLRAIFNFARFKDFVVLNPFLQDKIVTPKIVHTADRINSQDLFDLQNAVHLNPMLNDWFSFTYEHAMRAGESSRIRLAYVDLIKRLITIPALNNKNRQPFVIHLTNTSFEIVKERYVQAKEVKSPYLFFSVSAKTKEIIPFNYSYWFRKAKLQVGITHSLKPHLIRHTKVSEIIEETQLSDSQVMTITGHRSHQALKIYSHLKSAHHKSDMQSVSDITFRNRIYTFIANSFPELSEEEKQLKTDEHLQMLRALNQKN